MTSDVRRPHVAFDTAGGAQWGIGHVIRAAALAREARALGARVSLVDPPQVAIGSALRLPSTRRAPDVVAVDRPDTSVALLREHRRRWPAVRLVALDYYGQPVEGLVTVINLNDARVRRRAGTGPRTLHGLQYAALRPAFRAARRRRRGLPLVVRRVVVGFGGTDPSGWTVAAVRALDRALPRGVAIDILSGRALAAPRVSAAREIAVHIAVPDPSVLLQASDLAVIGGGTMMIEAACLGLPAIVIPRTPEERGFAAQFAAPGAIRVLRAARGLPAAALRRAAARLAEDPRARARMRRAGRGLVDGRGAERVARAIVRAARGPA